MVNHEQSKDSAGENLDALTDGKDSVQSMLETSGIASLTNDSSLSLVEAILKNLSALLVQADPMRRLILREAVVRKLAQTGIGAPAKLVDAALSLNGANPSEDFGQGMQFNDPEPWPTPVEGDILLAEIVTFVQRFVILPAHASRVIGLWILHTYARNAFDISPILAITSPTKRAGKTTLLEILKLLTPRSILASNISSASLFRSIEKFELTLLIDEADTFLKAKEELRGILNAGHRRSSAFVIRTVGDQHEPHPFCTWGPKAIALIGRLPSTLEDRSIQILMRRRTPREAIERLRIDKVTTDCVSLKRKAFRWASDNLASLREADPEIPSVLNDRAADNWRPLIAIADRIGGEWPTQSRIAARAFSETADESENSPLIQLLQDLKDLFEKRQVSKLSSAVIVATLGAMEDRRWSEWQNGEPLTTSQLASLLGRFRIRPQSIRVDKKTTAKGYRLEQFADAFLRYLPVRAGTPSQSFPDKHLDDIENVKQGEAVPDPRGSLTGEKVIDVTAVTDTTSDSEDQKNWEVVC